MGYIHVGNLAGNTTEQTLRTLFIDFDQSDTIVVVENCRSCAFLEVRDPESAVARFRHAEHEGRHLMVGSLQGPVPGFC